MIEREELLRLMDDVAAGRLAPGEAARRLGNDDYVDLGFAKVDVSRPRRVGAPEFVYCENKTVEQIISIVKVIDAAGQNVLCTRVRAEVASQVRRHIDGLTHNERARTLHKFNASRSAAAAGGGRIAVVAAGTSDLAVAEEAAVTAEVMGATVERLTDVGVAGLHRLLDSLGMLREVDAVVVVAGMEGALPSVVAGLIEAPVIAVPTSIGYGASFGGLAPLLSMLNSCSPGVSVVNIDNGFGAGFQAAIIARGRERVAARDGVPDS